MFPHQLPPPPKPLLSHHRRRPSFAYYILLLANHRPVLRNCCATLISLGALFLFVRRHHETALQSSNWSGDRALQSKKKYHPNTKNDPFLVKRNLNKLCAHTLAPSWTLLRWSFTSIIVFVAPFRHIICTLLSTSPSLAVFLLRTRVPKDNFRYTGIRKEDRVVNKFASLWVAARTFVQHFNFIVI